MSFEEGVVLSHHFVLCTLLSESPLDSSPYLSQLGRLTIPVRAIARSRHRFKEAQMYCVEGASGLVRGKRAVEIEARGGLSACQFSGSLAANKSVTST